MLRFLLKLTLLMTLALAVTSLAVRAIGSTQPPNPSLRGFTEGCEDKPQPCWYGIVPDVTTVQVAVDELKLLGYEYNISPKDVASGGLDYQSALLPCAEITLFASPFKPEQIDTLFFRECQSIYLGDFIRIFGTPHKTNVSDFTFLSSKVIAVLEFKSGQQGNNCLSFMPTSSIPSFGISFRNQSGTVDQMLDQWHGFLPYNQYISRYGFADCEILERVWAVKH
jgi:hypothetical protein